MDTVTLKKLIQTHLPDAEVTIQSDDNIHFFADIKSATFQNKSRVQQSQIIYSLLDPYIKNNQIHAISLKTHEK